MSKFYRLIEYDCDDETRLNLQRNRSLKEGIHQIGDMKITIKDYAEDSNPGHLKWAEGLEKVDPVFSSGVFHKEVLGDRLIDGVDGWVKL